MIAVHQTWAVALHFHTASIRSTASRQLEALMRTSGKRATRLWIFLSLTGLSACGGGTICHCPEIPTELLISVSQSNGAVHSVVGAGTACNATGTPDGQGGVDGAVVYVVPLPNPVSSGDCRVTVTFEDGRTKSDTVTLGNDLSGCQSHCGPIPDHQVMF